MNLAVRPDETGASCLGLAFFVLGTVHAVFFAYAALTRIGDGSTGVGVVWAGASMLMVGFSVACLHEDRRPAATDQAGAAR